MEKPFSPSCERNQPYILEVLRDELKGSERVIEIGSGTGQHAAFFTTHLIDVVWQPTDRKENLKGIQAWQKEAGQKNFLSPLEIELNSQALIEKTLQNSFDCAFTANTLHIMPQSHTAYFFDAIDFVLQKRSSLFIYGPFKYQGEFTSESNLRFDQWLKEQEPHRGIRNFEDVISEASRVGFNLKKDFKMPANNQFLFFMRDK